MSGDLFRVDVLHLPGHDDLVPPPPAQVERQGELDGTKDSTHIMEPQVIGVRIEQLPHS
jgi:hypothetical protein